MSLSEQFSVTTVFWLFWLRHWPCACLACENVVRRFQTHRERASEGLVSDAIKRVENLKCLIKQKSSMERINTPKVSTLAREGDPVHTAQRGPCFQQHNILGSAVRTSANGVPFISGGNTEQGVGLKRAQFW